MASVQTQLMDLVQRAYANPLAALGVLIGCAIFAFVLFMVILAARAAFYTTRTGEHKDEEHYLKPDLSNDGRFPSIMDSSQCHLSLVVPAYNEENRMTIMMDEMLEVLQQQQRKSKTFTYELIIVDDGSKDRTVEIAMGYVRKHGTDKIRVMRLHKNHGKGGAVRKGMLRARGEYMLMVDADGATEAQEVIKCLNKLKKVEKDGLGIAIGSRAHLEEQSKAQRSAFRKFLMWGFHTLVTVLVGGDHEIHDTQCGFKLFTREAARLLFPVMHIERWAFDVELLFLASKWKIPMVVSSGRLLSIPTVISDRLLNEIVPGGSCSMARGRGL
eukprot:gb/GECG01009029.1/.p1 GENE.gb/GECG01009029.1/~~gb/GECG01009029.1/.p1  ORF type:complete len:328 (+),score=36.42 gb/GECG01009029.1/:1-984(+)